MTLHLYLQVKFRIFGLSFGILRKVIDLSVNLLDRSFQVNIVDGLLPPQAHTLVNERGVLLASWL